MYPCVSLLLLPANLFQKKSVTHYIQTFVEQQPEKQLTCEFSENLKIGIVIKMLFRVSA